jgi:hypothetical protein
MLRNKVGVKKMMTDNGLCVFISPVQCNALAARQTGSLTSSRMSKESVDPRNNVGLLQSKHARFVWSSGPQDMMCQKSEIKRYV